MGELEQLQSQSRTLLVLTWAIPIVAALAVAAVHYCRSYKVEPRVEQLKAKAQQEREAALEQQATAAESRATRAEAAADAARQRADRHIPMPLSPELRAVAVRSVQAWASARDRTAQLVLVGVGTPAMDQVQRSIMELFESGGVRQGGVSLIGVGGGVPHGAFVFCGAESRGHGEALVSALKSLIRNLELRIEADPQLKLYINGRPAFERDGAFSIE